MTSSINRLFRVAYLSLSVFLIFMFLSFICKVYATEETITTISIASVANGYIFNAYPTLPLGVNTILGGIPFDIPTRGSGLYSYLDMESSSFFSHPTSGIIEVDIQNPISIHFLLASGNSSIDFENQKIGEIRLLFDDSTIMTENIVLGKNIREWCEHGSHTVNTISDPRSVNVWMESSQGGIGKLDMFSLEIPPEHHHKKLIKISVFDTSFADVNSRDPAVNWYGLSVKSSPSSTMSSALILPGMMACWDFGAVLKNEPGDNWRLIPGITDKIYRNLTKSFSDTDQQTQVWCYDWRRPIADNADALKAYLDSLTDPPDKINIIGHSMGGLVGRAFAQKYPDRLNKLITLGSPHDGAVKAYPLWEAGEIWEYSKLEKLLFKSLVSLHRDKLNNEHPMATVRRLVPSAKELLPTFDFLTDKDGANYKDIDTHKQQNTTMNDLNATLSSPIANQIYTITGTGKQTMAGLKTVSIGVPAANWVHQVVGLWEDGEPIHTCPSATCELIGWKKDYSISIIPSNTGDRTVLADSAALDPARNFEVTEEHSNLPSNSEVINKVHEYLGTGTTYSGSIPSLPQKFLLFFLRSPANLLVTSPSGLQAGHGSAGELIPDSFYDEDNKLVLIPDYENGDYSLTITGTDEGEYGLFLGRVDEAGETNFREYGLPTKAGQTDTFSIDSESDELKLEDPQGQTTTKSLETKLREMYGEDRNIHLRLALKFLELARAALAKDNLLMAGINLRLATQRLEHYFFKAAAVDLAENWDEAQAVLEDVKDLMALFEHRSIIFPRSKVLQKQLDWQISELARINKRYQKAAEAGKTHDTIKALVFLESGETLEEIQKAIDQHRSGLAEVLLSQNSAMMQYLQAK